MLEILNENIMGLDQIFKEYNREFTSNRLDLINCVYYTKRYEKSSFFRMRYHTCRIYSK